MKVGGLYIGNIRTWSQVLFWGGLWILIPLVLSDWQMHQRLLVRSLVIFAGITVVVAANLEGLLPALFYRKKYILYALCGIALIAAVMLLVEWDAMPWADYFNHPRSGRPDAGPGRGPGADLDAARIKRRIFFRRGYTLAAAMPYFTSFIGSALFEIANYANRQAKESMRYRKEKLEAELKFLKSQINPHFLFNALNNVYALSVIQSENTPGTILKLSGMLRYMLYDCKAERVPIGREIEYIRNYVDLVKLKDSRGLNIRTELDDGRPELMIAPLLFVPFIENAFKHSKIEDIETGWVRIRLLTEDHLVRFHISNSVPEGRYEKDLTGGIGMQNVQRQLELLYPDKHNLEIKQADGQFHVHLTIELDG